MGARGMKSVLSNHPFSFIFKVFFYALRAQHVQSRNYARPLNHLHNPSRLLRIVLNIYGSGEQLVIDAFNFIIRNRDNRRASAADTVDLHAAAHMAIGRINQVGGREVEL